jgi:hypothetical protein
MNSDFSVPLLLSRMGRPQQVREEQALVDKSAAAPATATAVMLGGLQNLQLQCSCYTIAIGRIGSSAVRNMSLQDLLGGAIDRASGVVEEQLLLLRRHLAEEIARLLPVIIL